MGRSQRGEEKGGIGDRSQEDDGIFAPVDMTQGWTGAVQTDVTMSEMSVRRARRGVNWSVCGYSSSRDFLIAPTNGGDVDESKHLGRSVHDRNGA